MSDILIRGMEMPKSEPMIVKINPDGSVSTTAKNNYRKYEAIPAKDHGDLIDRDKLIEEGTKDGAYGYVSTSEIGNAPVIIPGDKEIET